MPQQTGKRILIVDDDPDLRRGLSIWLRAHGYESIFAGDGVYAVATAVKEKPDLILLDLGLPAGDGFAVLARLGDLAAASYIPVIVVSARDEESSRDAALKAGAAAYIPKPVDNHRLLATIESCLAGQSL